MAPFPVTKTSGTDNNMQTLPKSWNFWLRNSQIASFFSVILSNTLSVYNFCRNYIQINIINLSLIRRSSQFDPLKDKYTHRHTYRHVKTHTHMHARTRRESTLLQCCICAIVYIPMLLTVCGVNTCTMLPNILDMWILQPCTCTSGEGARQTVLIAVCSSFWSAAIRVKGAPHWGPLSLFSRPWER